MEEKILAFIPDFIFRKKVRNEKKGSFRGSALFVDVSGFTCKTENLFKKADTGAEKISRILFSAFDMPLRAVYENGGFVSGFAGDAFLAIFPGDKGRSVCKTVEKMPKIFQNGPARGLTLKYGFSNGEIKWGITGNAERSFYYFSGEAVRKAFAAENPSIGNCSNSQKMLTFEDHGTQLETVQKHFFPEEIFAASLRSEIRMIVTVFVKFGEDSSHKSIDIASKVCFELSKKYWGYFNKIEYNDKGLTALVVFGAPKARENADLLSLKFCIEMISKFPEAKIGVDYGLAYAGLTGCVFRNEWTVIGDSVNTAARIMSTADKGEVLVSVNLVNFSTDIAVFDLKKTESLKGKKGPQKLFSLRELKKLSNQRYHTPFTGRKKDISELSKSLETVLGKDGKNPIFITGEVGIGKTRLVEEFLKSLDAGYDVTRLKCDGTVSEPWNPFKPWLKEFMGITDDKRKSLIKDIQNKLQGNFLDLNPYSSFIASMCGYKISNSLYEQTDEAGRLQIQIYCLTRLIEEKSSGKKAVVVVDDFQFIDELSRKFIEKIIRAKKDMKIGIILVSRKVDWVKDLICKNKYAEIDLKSLNKKIIETIIGHYGLYGKSEIAKTLIQKSQGNPFFAEQLAISLKENVKEKEIPQTKLPRTIYGVLTSRIDSLENYTKETVKTASVLGYAFFKRILEKLDGLKSQDLDQYLIEAIDKNVFVEKGGNYLSFSHNLLQEAAYNLLMPSERKELHRKALAAMEANRETETARIYEQAKRCGLTDKWLYWAKVHAENLVEKYALEEAKKIFSEIAVFHRKKSNEEQYSHTTLQLSKILEMKGEKSHALKALKNALASAKKVKNSELVSIILVNKAGVELAMGDILKAEKTLKRSAGIINKKSSTETFLDMENLQGLILRNQNKLNEALEKYEEALEIATKNSLALGQIKILMNMSAVFNLVGDYENSEKCLIKCENIKEFRKNKRLQAGVYNNLGINYLNRGLVKKSLSSFKKSYGIKKKIGDLSGQASSLHNMGSIQMKIGEKEKAEALLSESIDLYRKTEAKLGLMRTLTTMGALFESDLEKALSFYKEALSIALASNSAEETVILFNIGEAYRVKGGKAEAIASFKKSLKSSEKHRDERLKKTIISSIEQLKNEKKSNTFR
ncbi:tetratricopeptide repeat protein [candidate division WOR-3 bacterium]|nr:tetratricopeptide repeat protein [candidate division WOR-3 bacterium]